MLVFWCLHAPAAHALQSANNQVFQTHGRATEPTDPAVASGMTRAGRGRGRARDQQLGSMGDVPQLSLFSLSCTRKQGLGDTGRRSRQGKAAGLCRYLSLFARPISILVSFFRFPPSAKARPANPACNFLRAKSKKKPPWGTCPFVPVRRSVPVGF